MTVVVPSSFRHMPRAWVLGLDPSMRPSRLRPRRAARLVGEQPILTVVTVGELAQRGQAAALGPVQSCAARQLARRQAGHSRSVSGGYPARAASACERHLGCCPLPCLLAAAGHPHCRGRRRAPRVAAAQAGACATLAHRGHRARVPLLRRGNVGRDGCLHPWPHTAGCIRPAPRRWFRRTASSSSLPWTRASKTPAEQLTTVTARYAGQRDPSGNHPDPHRGYRDIAPAAPGRPR
jgi:hypothetical protein